VLIYVNSTLTLGNTLVRLIFMSDGTHLLNLAGDNKEWPGYMIMYNVSSNIRHMPSTQSVLIIALLPIPIINRNIPQKWLDKQREINREVLNEVLQRVLHPLTIKQYPSAKSTCYNVFCAVGNFGHHKLVLAALLADRPEYSDIHNLEQHDCFWVRVLK